MDMIEPCRFGKPRFALPGDKLKDKYLLPVSGGADSSALAVLMHELHPEVGWEMCFTDTLAESPELYESLQRLEAYLGKQITRITPEKGLYELIAEYNGFLPSAQSRYCTRELKLVPFSNWIKRYDGIQKWMFVGIRADESSRVAFTLNEVETVMPFVDLGLRREDIFAILTRSVGVPKFYRYRSRSGCEACPFQRRSEIVGLLRYEPDAFNRAMAYEKITEEDKGRHPEAPSLSSETGIALNWLTLPRPTRENTEGRARSVKKQANLSLFGENQRGIFVGAEFFMDGWMSDTDFIWHQNIISYSPTLAQIKRQIDDRYRLLLSSSETWDMTPDEVRRKAKFAIYYIELPETVFDPDRPEGGYTWRQGESFAQLRHIIQWATRALHAEGLRQEAAGKARSELSWQYEQIEASKKGLASARHEMGAVVSSAWYEADESEPVMDEEEELMTTPCPMCHL